eukprot:g3016.t1
MSHAGAALPIVDYDLLAKDRPAFFRQLQYALCDVGFMVLANAPGLDASFQRDCFAWAHAFFDLPEEAKASVALEQSPHFRGYSSTRQKARVNIASSAYQLGPECESRFEDRALPVHERILRGPNQWPDEEALFPGGGGGAVVGGGSTTTSTGSAAGGLKAQLRELHARYLKLAHELGELICELLGVERRLYDQYFLPADPADPPHFIAAMNHSVRLAEWPPEDIPAMREQLKSTRGAGAHVDGAPFVTLLVADQPGLEVLSKDGREWVDVPYDVPGGVCVNIGASLMKLSGGKMLATTHRVNPLKIVAAHRVSLPYFLLPSLDGELIPFDEQLATCPPAVTKVVRDRGAAYALDRMNLFPAVARRWYPQEHRQVAEIVRLEAERRAAARKARSSNNSTSISTSKL